MRKRVLLSSLLAAFAAQNVQAAAEVEVTWKDPDSYTDIRPTNETRSGFRERTFEELESYFVELAGALPEGQKLNVTVTNLDLAGQVWPSSFVGFGSSAGSDIRLIKRIDIPRMAFSYTLTDSSGQEVKSADVKIKDMGFMDGIRHRSGRDNLAYEKNMLRDWFEEEMSETTAQN